MDARTAARLPRGMPEPRHEVVAIHVGASVDERGDVLIRGFDSRGEAVEYGRTLLPEARRLPAQRPARRPMAAEKG